MVALICRNLTKVHRSVLNLMNRRNNSNKYKKKEEIELDTVREDEDDVTNDEDTNQLLTDNHKVTICSKEWWSKRLRNTKASFIKSMKNVKLFMW